MDQPPPLGLAYGRVEVVGSHPSWPARFQTLAIPLRQRLGALAVAVEHVGSTAVPGLAATPILDLAVGLAEGADADRVRQVLESLRYRYRGELDGAGGPGFVLEDRPGHRIAHAHAVTFGGRQWRRYLAFRDRLRTDAYARQSYALLKRRLAAQHPDHRAAYAAAKASFIAQLLGQAGGATEPA